MADGSGAAEQPVALPSGGGAVAAVGETFRPSLFTGTGNLTVPLPVTPGRGGAGPELSLAYSTGHGNGPFGLGWQLSLPRISRRTEHGVPRYDDTDVFVMDGAEDLVPQLERAGDTWAPWTANRDGWTVTRFRPRVEGLFARIERWTAPGSGSHWRVVTRDNVINVYGLRPAARLSDPADPDRVFAWLLEEVLDSRGNHIRYEYARENPAVVPPTIAEQGRVHTQAYPRRVLWGNSHEAVGPGRTGIGHSGPLADVNRHYLFELLFDYGDRPGTGDAYLAGDGTEQATAAWPVRPDPFSTYRSGFELRTLRRCRRVLLYHHFTELGGPTLVRSLTLAHQASDPARLSLLTAVTVAGHQRDGTVATLPPLTFSYTGFEPGEQRFQALTAADGQLPLMSLADPDTTLVDLFGTGLPGVLRVDGEATRYWRNLGDGHLDRPHVLHRNPVGVALSDPSVTLADLGGDGRPDLLVLDSPAGFYEAIAGTDTWQPLRHLHGLPTLDLSDPTVRRLDLTGDGRPDVLATRGERFLWWECLGERGYAPPRAVPRRHDPAIFPDVSFDDPSGAVRTADMTGDGLPDIVTVHDGRIDYWPSLGHGRFAPRVTMAAAPRLPTGTDPSRVFLVDVDGSGCADLVHVGLDEVWIWSNQSGNGWSTPRVIRGTPTTAGPVSVDFADVFGTGTTSVLWSRPADGRGANYHVLDLSGGTKPYLLAEVDNGMGGATRIRYGSAARHRLRDERAGTPWATPLPIPVQVVDAVEVHDRITGLTHVTRYRYHHGYFDGREREFRGFGRVDELDADSIDTPDAPPWNTAPAETRSWFHTGIWFDPDLVTAGGGWFDEPELTGRYRREYWTGPAAPRPLTAHVVEAGDTPHEAYRALRGAILRQEVFGRDGSERAPVPYRVAEHRWEVREVQPAGDGAPPVHLLAERENVTVEYERDPGDPRVRHRLALRVDDAGVVTDAVTVSYPRRPGPSRTPEQATLKVTYQHLDVATEDADPDWLRVAVPVQERAYEVHGAAAPADPAELLTAETFAAVTADPDVFLEYDAVPASTPSPPVKRLLTWSRTYYRDPATAAVSEAPAATALRLPLGTAGPLALRYEDLRAAFPESFVEREFGADRSGVPRVTPALLRTLGYRTEPDVPGLWWVATQRTAHDPDRFYLVPRVRDQFGADAEVDHDRYALLAVTATDRAGNTTRADNDYRVLQPWQVTDANDNPTRVAFDALGQVVAVAALGKGGEGDSLDDIIADLDPDELARVVADPVTGIGNATSRSFYDVHRYRRDGQPVVVHSLVRETHAGAIGGDRPRVHHTAAHQDGLGQPLQTSVTAEPEAAGAARRWVAGGRTIRNNKGLMVRQYQPEYADTWEHQDRPPAGTSHTLLYDPLGRQVAALHPDHTWEKTVFGPWRQATWDANDTAGVGDPAADPDVGRLIAALNPADYLPTWSAARGQGQLGPAEAAAATATAPHADTPTVAHLDTLGRAYSTVADNGAEGRYVTHTEFDVSGNPLRVVDPLGRDAATGSFDMLGRQARSRGLDTGERLLLQDAAGRPVLAWDARGRRHRTEYDHAGRQVARFVRTAGQATERCTDRTVYGENAPDATSRNLRGRVVRVDDAAGRVVKERYDFKGNLSTSTRRLATGYRTLPDWNGQVPLATESFTVTTAYDALDRPIELHLPDGTVVLPTYTAGNQLRAAAARLRGAAAATSFVDDIGYTARGERSWIDYGNLVRGDYEYDHVTYRLTAVRTSRPAGGPPLQALTYTYDPVGNITRRHDGRLPPAFYRNGLADGTANYRYDAVYRLVEATGREHLGQNAAGQSLPPRQGGPDDPGSRSPGPADTQAVGAYVEEYRYDEAGNLGRITHTTGSGRWVRRYAYSGNRLTATSRPGDPVTGPYSDAYGYDEHGNTTRMPHLAQLDWDDRDQLRSVDLGGGGTGWYTYDLAGNRVRTVIERQNGTVLRERVQLGGFEMLREFSGTGVLVDEYETVHVMDDTRRIALVETRTRRAGTVVAQPAPVILYQLGDHLGSAQLELTPDGALVSYAEYFPYGGTSYQVPRNGVDVSPKRFGHAGKERDAETGLAYYGARYYAPWLGRWLTADPAGTVDGLNLYCYVRGNPIRLVDPTGTQAADTTADPAASPPAEEPSPRKAWVEPGFVDNLGSFFTGVGHAFQKAGMGVLKPFKWIFWHGIAKIAYDVSGAEVLRETVREGDKITSEYRQVILDGPDALVSDIIDGIKEPLDRSVRALRRGDSTGWLEASGESVATLAMLGWGGSKAPPPGSGTGFATAEGMVLAGSDMAAVTPASLAPIGVAMAVSGAGDSGASKPAKGRFGGEPTEYWNEQNAKAAESVEQRTGNVTVREVELFIERTPGVLEKLGRRMDALSYNLETGAMTLYEWSTANCILNGSAKFKQLKLQLEIFAEARRTGATIWGVPQNIGIHLDVTRADQYIGTYSHWRGGGI